MERVTRAKWLRIPPGMPLLSWSEFQTGTPPTHALVAGHGIGRRCRLIGSPSRRLGLREQPEQTWLGGFEDAALRDEAGDEPRRGHVEGVVRCRTSLRRDADRLEAAR